MGNRTSDEIDIGEYSVPLKDILTLEDCDEHLDAISKAIIAIESQIDLAEADKASGIDVDLDWLARCKSALKYRKHDRYRLHRHRDALKEEQDRKREAERKAKADAYIAQQAENARIKAESKARNVQLSQNRDRELLDFIKNHEPEAFYRCVRAFNAAKSNEENT